METFFLWLFGSLVLPVVLIAMLSTMMGLKPESILMPLSSLFGVIFKLILDLTILLIRIIGGGALMLIARVFNAR
jgi:hypothetical protein